MAERINDKHSKDVGVTPENPNYKKKSIKKGLPRADHKHTNILVKLKGYNCSNSGNLPLALVCTQCGRIDNVFVVFYAHKTGEMRYDSKPITEEELASLPVYKADKVWGKFAFPV